jgi:tetratricopeptide (TPR) repeat protein
VSETAETEDGAPLSAARSLLDEIRALRDRGDHAEAIAACDDVARRFADEVDAAVSERVAFALLLKGLSLGKLGRRDEAVVVYECLIARYGDSADPATVLHLAWAFNKSVQPQRASTDRAFDRSLRRADRALQ